MATRNVALLGTINLDFISQRDWRYASVLGLSMCIGVRIILTKTAPEKFAIISRIGRVRSYAIRAVQRYDCNTAAEAMKAHSAMFGDDNGQYFV